MQLLDTTNMLGGKYRITELHVNETYNFLNASFVKESDDTSDCIIVFGEQETMMAYYNRWIAVASRVQLPEVTDFFSENGTSYLVVEDVGETGWTNAVHFAFGHAGWWFLPYENQKILLRYVKDVLTILQSLDAMMEPVLVSPDLFILREKKISLKLLPDKILWKRTDLFTQEKNSYNLALMIIHCLTDLVPIKLDYLNPRRLRKSLLYFIADSELVEVLVKCLTPDVSALVTLQELFTEIFAFERRVVKGKFATDVFFFASFNFLDGLEQLVLKSIQNVCAGEWSEQSVEVNGFPYAGISYFREKLDDLFPVEKKEDTYKNVVERFGLGDQLDGATGSTVDIASGLAGRCLYALTMLQYDGEGQVDEITGKYLNELISRQLSDGSWADLCIAPRSSGAAFWNGVAGIAFVLWLRYRACGEQHVLSSARRAMDWLLQQAVHKENRVFWYRDGGRLMLPGFASGVAGIAFTFIIAAEITGDKGYKEIAEKSLLALPDRMYMNRFGYLAGLAGIGDVYMEAWRVFGNPIWKTRAHTIAETIYYTGRLDRHDCLWWAGDGEANLTNPSLLTGDAGILYFLWRFIKRDINHLFVPKIFFVKAELPS